MYSDEELMLFAESYETMQKRGTAGKKIVGSVAERLNEKIDEQLRASKLKAMIGTLLECKEMKKASAFLNGISINSCTSEKFEKVEKLYKLYKENFAEDDEDIDANVDEADDEESEDPDVAVAKAGFINDYKSEKMSIYKILLGFVEFGNWIMVHGKNDERTAMKALLAVLEDEFIPKFSELPGADASDDTEAEDDTEDDTEAEDSEDTEDTEEDDIEEPADDDSDTAEEDDIEDSVDEEPEAEDAEDDTDTSDDTEEN